jgi:hypothetical protein
MAGYGSTLVAILLLVLSAWFACSRYSLLSSWVRTDAEILNGDVYSDFTHYETRAQTRIQPVFGFRCTVRFQANGRLYEAPADIGYKKSSKSEMIDCYLRFPAGGSTKIAYDPVDPNRVILAEDLRTSYAGALVIFAVPISSERLTQSQLASVRSWPERISCAAAQARPAWRIAHELFS